MSLLEQIVANHAPDARRTEKGYLARCPVPGHGKGRGDKNPSLSLNEGEDGRVLIKCHGTCATEDVLAAWGLHVRDLYPVPGRERTDTGWTSRTTFEQVVTRARRSASKDLGAQLGDPIAYDYREPGGTLSFRVLRFEDGQGEKTFRPVHEGPNGWRMGYPTGPRLFYRLNELPSDGTIFLVEGEKTADAGWSIGVPTTTTPGGSSGGKKADWSPLAGREVVVLPDADDPGRTYALDARARLEALGPPARVAIVDLPDAGAGDDLHDHVRHQLESGLSEADIRAHLLELVEGAKDRESQRGLEPLDSWGPYRITNGEIHFLRKTPDGPIAERLTNFVARITGDVLLDDGLEQERRIELRVTLHGREIDLTIRGSQFQSMSWVQDELGPAAIVSAGFSTRDRTREAIQVLSGRPKLRRQYACTGWMEVEGVGNAYMTATGALWTQGTLSEVETVLEGPASKVALPEPVGGAELKTSVRETLGLLELAPDRISLPLLAAVARAPLGEADMSVMLVGESGVFKTEMAALCQQFWGPELDSRNLPAAWVSTANALEAQAFLHKDSLLVIDEFTAGNSPKDLQRLYDKAERVLRGQGNRAGRTRLRSDTSLRQARRPRGLILSTGEGLPPGHSLLARIQVIEVRPGEIKQQRLTVQQRIAREGAHARVMASYVQYLAGDLGGLRERFRLRRLELREELAGTTAHLRTTDIVCQQLAAFEVFAAFLKSREAITPEEGQELCQRTRAALLEIAEEQADDVASEAPVTRFVSLINEALLSGEAHLAGYEGQEPRMDAPQAVGWRQVDSRLVASGSCIGFIGEDGIYLLPEASSKAASRAAPPSAPFAISKVKLGKALAAEGLLLTTERGRKKNTIRRMLNGKQTVVLHLPASLLAEGSTGSIGADSSPRNRSWRKSKDPMRDPKPGGHRIGSFKGSTGPDHVGPSEQESAGSGAEGTQWTRLERGDQSLTGHAHGLSASEELDR